MKKVIVTDSNNVQTIIVLNDKQQKIVTVRKGKRYKIVVEKDGVESLADNVIVKHVGNDCHLVYSNGEEVVLTHCCPIVFTTIKAEEKQGVGCPAA